MTCVMSGLRRQLALPVQGPPLGPRGSEGLGLLEAEHNPLSSDGGRAFYSSQYHEHQCAAVVLYLPAMATPHSLLSQCIAQHLCLEPRHKGSSQLCAS